MSKLYAVQVAPEEQYPTCLEEVINDDVASGYLSLYGNAYYESHMCDLFCACKSALEDSDIWDAIDELRQRYAVLGTRDVRGVFDDMLPHAKTRGEYTHAELNIMVKVIDQYADCDISLEDGLVTLLTIVSGHEWKHTEIRGNCQGDWQDVYYDTTVYDTQAIDYFECEYFNMGTEWIVAQLDEKPEHPTEIPESDDAMWIYCHENDIDKIKREIRDCYGSEDDIVMYRHSGRRIVHQYTEI